MEFPLFVSFTITNACNLRCQMCGQWSSEGYINNKTKCADAGEKMTLSDWKKLVDEIARHKIRLLLVRGGEPFLFPGIMDLLKYINSRGIFIALDTNGTMMEKCVEEVAKLNNMHITFSVDGPEDIHDQVRGIPGSFRKTKDNIALLNQLDKDRKISTSICFTISPYSYKGLGAMPIVARSMGIRSINKVPYYYVPDATGREYEKELKDNFGTTAYSWKGFHHNESGVDFRIFREELQKYYSGMDGLEDSPFLPLTEEEYKVWFRDASTPVGSLKCNNVEKVMDIQPDGSANFCVDYPDYSFGNVKKLSIEELWNSREAEKFRRYRRENPLAVCYRCGGKYISEIKD